jgi:hypothetical protein
MESDVALPRYVKAYATDVNTSHTPKEGAHSPSWPTGLILIIIIISIVAAME